MIANIEDNLPFEGNKCFWKTICQFCSIQFLLKHEDIIDWKAASSNRNLSIDLMRRHKDDLNFFILSFWIDANVWREFEEQINNDQDYVKFKNEIEESYLISLSEEEFQRIKDIALGYQIQINIEDLLNQDISDPLK